MRSAMISAAAAAARRDPRCRSLATLTATASAAQGMPWLLVTSPSNLKSRYLYALTSDTSSRPASLRLNLDREISLPEISRNWIIGSSHGYLISMPTLCARPRTFHAINPVTGTLLQIPSTSDLMIRVKGSKAVLSPSLDMVALLPGYQYPRQIGLARLRSPSSSWSLLDLPDRMSRYIEDCIFHKGCLYITDAYASVAVFDIGGPSVWEDLHTSCVRSVFVESPEGDDLYLLVRECSYDSDARLRLRFKVFKLDEDDGQWKSVESIGDLAFFVATNGAISLHAHLSLLLKPNCIYFVGYNKDDIGMYYLKSKRSKRIEASDGDHILTLNHLPPILFQAAWACPSSIHQPR